MRRFLPALLIAACALPYQPFEGHPVLAAIRFEGNKSIKDKDLLDHIVTAPSSGFFSKTPRYYDADLFALDLKRIVRWYNEKGFYEAQVRNVQELRDDKGRVTLVVSIDEGRRAIIEQQDYLGLEDLPEGERSDINDALPIHAGDPFDEDGYEKAKDVLLEQLKEHGFAEAKVEGKVEVSPDDGSAHIVFTCDKGKRFKFGKVVVSGNRQIPSDQIATATGLDRGDQYSPSAIALAQQRVYNLGAFSGVRVALEPIGDTPVAAVRVNVREAPFQTVRFGVGGSIEQTRWELPRLRAEYTNRSLFGGLRRLELASTVGYAFVSSPFEYDPSQSGITTANSAVLTIPNVLIPGLDWVSRGEFNREVQAGFNYFDFALRTGLLYRRGRHSVAPSINFVRYFGVSLEGADLATRLAHGGASAGITQECPSQCTLSYPEIRYTYDGRDNAIEPTQGFYFTTSLAQTLKPGDFSYFRVEPDFRFYTPASKYAVFAGRVLYGGMFAQGSGTTPFTQRFFFGGQNEQRGYAPLRQGPKLGACDTNVDPNCTGLPTIGVPIGGTSAVLLSAELRIHADSILNHLGIVPFVDASRVQDDPKAPLSNGGLEVATGLGLRYITAFGPLRVDFGYLVKAIDIMTQPVTTKDANGNPVTVIPSTLDSPYCKSGRTDCIHESRWAVHVTLGEAF
ncbi:MAG TPA: BamA/TamA family outer membrane protein [Myxococcales bacterium]|nr:BamA/TamA family outer membrane protein [Myxococcales bacterium]